jgi:hypothetical protein
MEFISPAFHKKTTSYITRYTNLQKLSISDAGLILNNKKK